MVATVTTSPQTSQPPATNSQPASSSTALLNSSTTTEVFEHGNHIHLQIPPTLFPVFNPSITSPSKPKSTIEPPLTDHQCVGDDMPTPKPPNITRLLFGNVNGIRYSPAGDEFRDVLETLLSTESDICCLSEHNLDTTQYKVSDLLFKTIRQTCPHSKLQINSSNITLANPYKPGGTATLAFGDIVGRLEHKGGDSMGRWSYMQFLGKNRRIITVISVYQVCAASRNRSTGRTAHEQQVSQLRRQGQQEPNPRNQFRTDLGQFISKCLSSDELVVVGGDFNDYLGSPNSSLLSLISQSGLVDAWRHQHPKLQEPNTQLTGSHRIDAVFISPELLPSLSSIGYLPFHSITNSDHRFLHVEFLTNHLFGNETFRLASMPQRGINSKDPSCNTTYIQTTFQHCEAHHLFATLNTIMTSGQANHEKIEKIDRILGQACVLGEKRCKKKRRPWWSCELGRVRAQLNALRSIKSGFINNKLNYAALSTRLTRFHVVLEQPTTLSECRHMIRAKYQELQRILRTARQQRQADQLAQEALADSTNDTARAQRIRTIRNTEKRANTFHVMGRLRGRYDRNGITKLDIPQDWPEPQDTIDNVASLSDPKTCHEWRTVTLPAEIEYYLRLRNRLHFGQAQDTPFTRPPLNEMIDWAANSHTAELILDGEFDTTELDDVTELLLKHCRRTHEIPDLQGTLTMTEFCDKMKVWNERTSTSPSGRHLGHYKSLISRHDLDPESEAGEQLDNQRKALLNLHVQLINYCIVHGYVLNRWKDVVNVMIFKDAGNHKIHRLRIIHLYEADYNLLLGTKWRKGIRQSEHLNSTHRGQLGGKPGRDATTLTLMEELKTDISFASRRSLINFDNDAASCYDRIIVSLASLISRRFGQSSNVVFVNAMTLKQARYRIKTALGVSDDFYSHSSAFPLHGTGQGSGNSPVIWCFISSVLFECHEENSFGAYFSTPDGELQVSFSMVGFVDDSTGSVNDFFADQQPSPEELALRMATDAQLWNDLLWSSGGLLELDKCSYHLLHFDFYSNGRPRVWRSQTGPKLVVTHAATGESINIPFKPVDQPHKTLGHWKSPAGPQRPQPPKVKTQRQQLCAKAEQLSLQIASGPLDRFQARVAYDTIYCPSVKYILPQSFFDLSLLDKIEKQSMQRIIGKCGFNRNTAHSIIYGPSDLAGGCFLHWKTLQGEGQITSFLKHWRTNSDASRLLRIALAWSQYQAGIGKPILESVSVPLPHLESRWIPSLRNFLNLIGGSIRVDKPYTSKLQRSGDVYIMDYALQLQEFSDKQLRLINYCRLYLDALTLSDICTANGDKIRYEALVGTRNKFTPTRFLRTNQKRPARSAWKQWQRLLSYLTTKKTTLIKPLGPWHCTARHLRQRWPCYYHTRYPFAYLWHSSNQYIQFEQNDEGVYTDGCRVSHLPEEYLVPADATLLGARLHLHNHPHVLHEANHTPANNTFQAFTLSLPQWEQDLLKHVDLLFTPSKLLQSARNVDTKRIEMLIVSDGSINQQSMSFGWAVATTNGTRLAQSSGPAFGKSSSHRAEGTGMLSAVVFTRRLLEFCTYSQSGTVNFYSDNEGLITRITQRLEYTDNYPNATLAADWDLVEQICSTVHSLPVSSKFHWVKGHQDDEEEFENLTIPAQLNIEADDFAGAFGKYRTIARPLVPLLPNTRAHFDLQGNTITSNYHTAIRCTVGHQELQEKMCRDNKWPAETFETIDWPVFSSCVQAHAFQQVQVTKLVHRLLPTNKLRHRYGIIPTAYCEKCHQDVETFEHVIQCPHHDRVRWRANLLRSIRQLCDHTVTRESLLDCLIQGLDAWLRAQPLDISKFPPPVHELLQHQSRIGWGSLMRGFVSPQWASLQDEYLHHTKQGNKFCTGALWISKIIRLIWDHIWILWQTHNDEIHGSNAKEREQRRCLRLRTTIQHIHNRKSDILDCDKQYLIPDLPTYLTTATSQQMSTWITLWLPILEDSIRMKKKAAIKNTHTLDHYFPRTQSNPTGRPQPRCNRRFQFRHDNTRKKRHRNLSHLLPKTNILQFFRRITTKAHPHCPH